MTEIEAFVHQVIGTRHVLAVNDLQASADHYINVLGFERDFAVDGWEFLSFDTFRVMLGECKDEVPASDTNNHSYFAYVLVADVDSVYANIKANGGGFTQQVIDKPWGHSLHISQRRLCIPCVCETNQLAGKNFEIVAQGQCVPIHFQEKCAVADWTTALEQ